MGLRGLWPGSRAPLVLSLVSRRALTSVAVLRPPACLPHRTTDVLARPLLNQTFRRTFADQAPSVTLSPTPKPRKRFRIFRWLWRITYLSVLGTLAYLSYMIWYIRNPNQQFEPDPSKKTLVVLGK